LISRKRQGIGLLKLPCHFLADRLTLSAQVNCIGSDALSVNIEEKL
jgi:hypothetical protein